MTGDGRKVILHDTDHLCGICGDRAWVWMAFTRGLNPTFMDGYDGAGYGVGGAGFDFNNPTWVSLRSNLGYTRRFAERMKLAQMTPQNGLASTGYCLAHAATTDAAYLVYLPDGNKVTVDLTAATGELMVEWFDPETGATRNGGSTTGGAKRTFSAPFANDAVLYIYQTSVTPTVTPTIAPTVGATRSPTATATPTLMATRTQDVTPTGTPTATPCLVPTATPILVGTPTATPIPALVPTVALTVAYRNYLPITQQC